MICTSSNLLVCWTYKYTWTCYNDICFLLSHFWFQPEVLAFLFQYIHGTQPDLIYIKNIWFCYNSFNWLFSIQTQKDPAPCPRLFLGGWYTGNVSESHHPLYGKELIEALWLLFPALYSILQTTVWYDNSAKLGPFYLFCFFICSVIMVLWHRLQYTFQPKRKAPWFF